MENTMKNVTEYSAAPDTSKFREIDTIELAEIIREIRSSEDSAMATEWSRDAWQTDIDAATRAAELMDAFGHRVFVAQDEDGYYFATEEVNYETCEDCREKFIAADGFCADDMSLCRACAIKYAEKHPDQIEAIGRSF
jgi:formylmethanofuran dehydrogenase subunit E